MTLLSGILQGKGEHQIMTTALDNIGKFGLWKESYNYQISRSKLIKCYHLCPRRYIALTLSLSQRAKNTESEENKDGNLFEYLNSFLASLVR